ncbi:chaoptin-like [Atheta coriaria]|uniref:chaoptin-like n=1 Tax=Dalotia coriaria TaxID=877792 RepID=UPI0031F40C2B
MQNLKFSDFTLQTVITDDIAFYFGIVELIIEDSQIDRIVNFAFPKQKSSRYGTRDVNYRFVSFKNNNISTIEENAFNNLESVTKFSFSNNIVGNKIGTITSLSKLVSVTSLDLSNNNLTSISNELFTANINIQYLNLSNSQIKHIVPNAFIYLSKLEVLDLSMNMLLNVHQNNLLNLKDISYIFHNLSALHTLILFGNNISNFDNALGYLPSLEELDLSHQNLNSISNELFPEISALRKLNMSNNIISKITPNAFKNLKELMILDLSNNKLNVLNPISLQDSQNPNTPKYIFDNLQKLHTIILFVNNISNFDNALGYLPSLHKLDLTYQNLSSISNKMFPEISAIKYLNISNNKINQIYPNTFVNMQNLEHLDLSHNQIKNMHIASLHGLLVLQSLNLSYNHYTVDKYLIFNTPKLSFLDISYNNLSDIDETLFKGSHLSSINIDGMQLSCTRLVEIVKYFKTLNINCVAGKEQNRLHLFGMHCNHSDVIESTTMQNIIESTNIPNSDIQLSNNKILSEVLNVLKHINNKNLNANLTQVVTQVHDVQEKSDKTTHVLFILLILLILMLCLILVFLPYIWRKFDRTNQYVPTENLITDFELSNR